MTYNNYKMLRFQKLPIYNEVRIHLKEVYLLASKLPLKEKNILYPQLLRAATSMLLNISEGSMKKSDAEFNRFIMIAIGSASEVVAIIDICLDQKYITPSTHELFMLKSESIIKQLYGFSRYLKSK
jgi:four helix bundle protein